MLKHILLASLGLLAAAVEPPTPVAFDCGTNVAHAGADFMKTIQELHGDKKSGSHTSRAALVARDNPINIDAVFHIVSSTDMKDAITNDMPSGQLDALNKAYNPYNIHFNLINTTWTVNDAWAKADLDHLGDMKAALRQGTYTTLNIYFQTDVKNVLGHCTLPSTLSSDRANGKAWVDDGCNVNANTMPNGLMDGYNMGGTAIHETGHWLGLLHTFEGNSCTGPGDYIDDTPPEREATNGCPTSPAKRTCPDQQKANENDPIHNYMDYSIDECYEGFTDLQVKRMFDMWKLYRKGN
jgi:hypothetical protein